MDRIAFYADTVRKILEEVVAWLPQEATVRTEVIFDDTRGHYEISQIGWDGLYRVHGSLIHVDIRDGKVWVEHNGTDLDIVQQMVEAGIPKDHIVLGFQPPEQRKYTEFAVA
jgi:hypothetical protein